MSSHAESSHAESMPFHAESSRRIIQDQISKHLTALEKDVMHGSVSLGDLCLIKPEAGSETGQLEVREKLCFQYIKCHACIFYKFNHHV